MWYPQVSEGEMGAMNLLFELGMNWLRVKEEIPSLLIRWCVHWDKLIWNVGVSINLIGIFGISAISNSRIFRFANTVWMREEFTLKNISHLRIQLPRSRTLFGNLLELPVSTLPVGFSDSRRLRDLWDDGIHVNISVSNFSHSHTQCMNLFICLFVTYLHSPQLCPNQIRSMRHSDTGRGTDKDNYYGIIIDGVYIYSK